MSSLFALTRILPVVAKRQILLPPGPLLTCLGDVTNKYLDSELIHSMAHHRKYTSPGGRIAYKAHCISSKDIFETREERDKRTFRRVLLLLPSTSISAQTMHISPSWSSAFLVDALNPSGALKANGVELNTRLLGRLPRRSSEGVPAELLTFPSPKMSPQEKAQGITVLKGSRWCCSWVFRHEFVHEGKNRGNVESHRIVP